MLAAGASASDASASDVAGSDAVAVAVQLTLDGTAVTVPPILKTRFDRVGTGVDAVYRATYDLGDPDDADGYKLTLTLVSVRPFDHPELAEADLIQAAYQIKRSARGNQVSRQSVFAGDQVQSGAVRIDAGHLAVRLEQHSAFAGFDLSTVVAVSGLPRS
jgi:hypothetical protein